MSTNPKSPNELDILFVDDETDNLDAFVFNCEEFWNTHALTSPHDVMDGSYSLEKCDAVIVDLVLNYSQESRSKLKINPADGLTFLTWLQENHPNLPVMVLSAYLNNDLKGTINAKFPKVLCKEKPLDFSRVEFREMMQNFIRDYRGEK